MVKFTLFELSLVKTKLKIRNISELSDSLFCTPEGTEHWNSANMPALARAVLRGPCRLADLTQLVPHLWGGPAAAAARSGEFRHGFSLSSLFSLNLLYIFYCVAIRF